MSYHQSDLGCKAGTWPPERISATSHSFAATLDKRKETHEVTDTSTPYLSIKIPWKIEIAMFVE